jgi:hypothetical protein
MDAKVRGCGAYLIAANASASEGMFSGAVQVNIMALFKGISAACADERMDSPVADGADFDV